MTVSGFFQNGTVTQMVKLTQNTFSLSQPTVPTPLMQNILFFFFPPFNLNFFKDPTYRQDSMVVKTPDAGATFKSQLYHFCHLSQVT